MNAVRTHVVLAGLLALSLATGAAAAESENVNVSRLPELQTGATIAIDPLDSETLLAGSNSIEEGTMRIYSSTDGGRSWTTARAHPPPAKPLASCSSDPGVAIDAKGRQYYSFVRATPCRDGARQYVYVVVRTGPEADVVETHPRSPTRDSKARRQACHRGRQLARRARIGDGCTSRGRVSPAMSRSASS